MIEKYNYNAVNCWQIFQHPFCKSGEFSFAKNKRTRRYMREMGIHGFCPGPNLSKRLHGKYLYPYLLRGLNIDHPNQVWSIDVTYCRMKRGFMYLVAIIDWYSRYIVGFELSNTLDRTFVIEAIQKAIKRHGKPVAYFGDIRTPIPGTSGQHNGIIRTAFRWHTDILSSL